jgi:recombination protein RecT
MSEQVEIVKAAEKQKSPIVAFRELLTGMRGHIANALPKHVDVDRMIRISVTAAAKPPAPGKPGILDCTRDSVINCIMQCAQLGLEPNGPLGEAYLIPFKDFKSGTVICTLIIGYRGLVKLARQSAEISSVCARAVHAKDDFDYELGLNERLRHIPSDEEDPGPLVRVYSVFRLKDGGVQFDVMSKREVELIRKRSKASDSGPWVTDYEEMAKKTVIRRTSKLAPASIDDKLHRAVAIDEASDDVEREQILEPHGLQLPPEPVPGVAPAEQGRRVALGRKPAEPKAAEAKADALITTGKGTPATNNEAAIILAAAQSALARRLSELEMGNHEITEQYEVTSIQEMTLEQCQQALGALASK